MRHLRGDAFQPGETRIGLPVPGVGHRLGPGALCMINYSNKVMFRNVEVWSAPWFSFHIYRNRGLVRFDSVHVRPRPGSTKVLTSSRDAFHAKGNRGRLEFLDCVLSGLGDDSFNISTHASRIRRVNSDREIEIRQRFPIQYIPLVEGDTLVVMNPEDGKIVGRSRILSISEQPVTSGGRPASTYGNQFQGNAPVLRLELEQAIPEMDEGMIAFSPESSNPDTLIRGCSWDRSARFQSNVVLEDCEIKAFTWFYAADIEGPGPEKVEMRNNRVRTHIRFSGWEGSRIPDSYEAQEETAQLQSVVLHNNTFWGRVRIERAWQIELSRNHFPEEPARRILDIRASGSVRNITLDGIICPCAALRILAHRNGKQTVRKCELNDRPILEKIPLRVRLIRVVDGVCLDEAARVTLVDSEDRSEADFADSIRSETNPKVWLRSGLQIIPPSEDILPAILGIEREQQFSRILVHSGNIIEANIRALPTWQPLIVKSLQKIGQPTPGKHDRLHHNILNRALVRLGWEEIRVHKSINHVTARNDLAENGVKIIQIRKVLGM